MTIALGKQLQPPRCVSYTAVQILVLNSGSSSIKFSFFDAEETAPQSVFEGEVSGIGTPGVKAAFRNAAGDDLAGPAPPIASMDDAVKFVVAASDRPDVAKIEAIGYRVVHPGPRLHEHQRITDTVLDDLRHAATFAPLHDPAVVKLIETMRHHFPTIAHIACFDTVFHRTMPPEATTYPLPASYAAEGVRRYGFHGLSCESIVQQLRASVHPFPRRLAIAHLGGGSSVTALVDGRSVDTSMGLTPTGGVVMATRPGDLDPGLMLYLLRRHNGDADAVEAMLNHDAGLAALGGTGSGDMRALRSGEATAEATLALRIFTRSITKALGGYLALLGGLDAIVFSGGIGEHDAASRAGILASLAPLGMALDPARNAAPGKGLQRISTDASPTGVFIVPAEEDLMIAQHVMRLCQTAQ